MTEEERGAYREGQSRSRQARAQNRGRLTLLETAASYEAIGQSKEETSTPNKSDSPTVDVHFHPQDPAATGDQGHLDLSTIDKTGSANVSLQVSPYQDIPGVQPNSPLQTSPYHPETPEGGGQRVQFNSDVDIIMTPVELRNRHPSEDMSWVPTSEEARRQRQEGHALADRTNANATGMNLEMVDESPPNVRDDHFLNDEIQQELTNLKGEINDLQEKLSNQGKKVIILGVRLGEEQKLRNKLAGKDQEKAIKIAELEEAAEKDKQKIEQLQDSVKIAKENIDELKDAKRKLEQQVQKATTKDANLRSMQMLNSTIEKLKTERAEQDKRIATLIDEANDLQHTCSNQTELRKNTEADKDKLVEAMRLMTENHTRTDATLERVKTELRAAKEEREYFKTQLQTELDKTTAPVTNPSCAKKCQDLSKRLNEAQETNKSLKDQFVPS